MEKNEQYILFESNTIEVLRQAEESPVKNGVILWGKEEKTKLGYKEEDTMPLIDSIEFKNEEALNLFQSGLEIMQIALNLENQ